MITLLPFLTLNETSEKVQAWVSEELTSAGFRVVPTFNLKIARLAHPDCSCPYHGTDDCNCQMVVLLVYDEQGDPVTLVIHGQKDQAWLSLATPMETGSWHSLESSVRNVLVPRHPNPPPSVEAMYEARPTR
ncbi:MAG TPA: hypothetical protein VFQ13_16170 [Anaerolineales bacterium]|nr:hypothetical protein [Anaerolineales bacterium]